MNKAKSVSGIKNVDVTELVKNIVDECVKEEMER